MASVTEELDFKLYLILNSHIWLLIVILGRFIILMLYDFNFQIISVNHWELFFAYGIRYGLNFIFVSYGYPVDTAPFI